MGSRRGDGITQDGSNVMVNLFQEVEDFLKAVRTGGTVRTPARDAFETHRLTDRILRAAGLPGMDA